MKRKHVCDVGEAKTDVKGQSQSDLLISPPSLGGLCVPVSLLWSSGWVWGDFSLILALLSLSCQ